VAGSSALLRLEKVGASIGDVVDVVEVFEKLVGGFQLALFGECGGAIFASKLAISSTDIWLVSTGLVGWIKGSQRRIHVIGSSHPEILHATRIDRVKNDGGAVREIS